MIPERISIVTYNLWNVERWPEREPAMDNFFKTYNPDIFCIQELRNETMACLEQSLKTHDHVDDVIPGWSCESNIFWNRNYFEEVDHGLEDLKMQGKYRGFFWVRLKFKGSDRTIFISTAHFTWQGNKKEIETGKSPRFQQCHDTIKYLKKLVKKGEPSFFMGDLNDPVVPHLFFPPARYSSCFKALNQLCPPTYPSLPTTGNIVENQAIDWIFCSDNVITISASVPRFFYNGIAPSDHWPIHAVYQL